jgi:hypothetical protein
LLQDREDTYVASAYAVEVMSQQDLEIVSIKIPSGEFGVGDVVQAEIVIKNHSDAEVSSDDLSFEFVASKDPVLGNGDDYLISSGHTAQEAVLANSTVTTSIEFVIPADATAGSVYVGVYAQLPSNYDELNKANNIQRTESAVLNIPEWELNLVTLGNGQVNQDFAAMR